MVKTGWIFFVVSGALLHTFGFSALLYGDIQERPENGDEPDKWECLNALVLDKLKFYVLTGVHRIIWKGKTLMATQYYKHLHDMFLAGDMHSR